MAPVYSTQENFKHPILQYSGEGSSWILVEDYTFEWGTSLVRKRINVFAPFDYNKADVPYILQKLVPQDRGMEGPSLIHDAQCREKGKQTEGVWNYEIMVVSEGLWKPDQSRWKRWECDDLCGFTAKCARIRLAGMVAPALKANPVNWFKMF